MGWANWEPAESGAATEALAELAGDDPGHFFGAKLTEARSTSLSFYRAHRLLDLGFERHGEQQHAYVLEGRAGARWLDGSSMAVHSTNDVEALALTDDTVEDYVRFFLYFLRADGRAFVLVEPTTEITPLNEEAQTQAELAVVRSHVIPLTPKDADDEDDHGERRWLFDAALAYDGALFTATIAVSPNGLVEMIDDNPIETLEHLAVPDYPVLAPSALVDDTTGEDGGGDEERALADLAGAPLLQDDGTAERDQGRGAQGSLQPLDRVVTTKIISVLLEDAIQALPTGTALLQDDFNKETGVVDPIATFTRFVRKSRPVVIIESDIPFVEDVVANLIDGPRQLVSGGAIAKAYDSQGDELRCAVRFEDENIKLHLISFHAYASLWAAERTANELALSNAVVLIGCDRSSAVPAPLRTISDLTLIFPRIDPSRFARIFTRVFESDPPAGWDADGANWTRDLVPADFHMAARLGDMDLDRALEMLRERADQRLRSISTDTGPSLSELHGLGEARQICEDLIADIGLAIDKQIPWSAVDGGLLLVGKPGVGKTTLARALAKACGIKFISASASAWQSAGALDAHLRAMRTDFAEARRYAPAILFIDEIDSIGSRESLEDRNAVYQTDVINALLEQIQGIDPVDPVIVIGATNYAEKVDPALRRAGRLDQVVEIPLPNVDGLEKIFEHYLKGFRDAGNLATDVDVRTLAELSLGLTGADVEFFVRGAYRRARRAKRQDVNQADLTAEVTRRPRHPDSGPRLGRDALHRVAVHEAGHAVATLTSSSRGADLTFLTIVPRLDGSLGFVASVPRDDFVLTRRTLLERLETALAGRAAEEIAFGPDEIGAGAGGPSPTSDLAVATSIATFLVCQAGLGDDGALHWTEQPSAAQQSQIDEVLDRAYRNIVERLKAEQALHGRIVSILEDKQELSGNELRRLLDERG